jgi:hypothetical protein
VVRAQYEARYEAAAVVSRAPALGDLDGIALVADGIEDRLLGERYTDGQRVPNRQ